MTANPYFHVLNPSRFHDPALAGGVGRINASRITNATGPDTWYTDPFGRTRSYGGPGVDAPN